MVSQPDPGTKVVSPDLSRSQKVSTVNVDSSLFTLREKGLGGGWTKSLRHAMSKGGVRAVIAMSSSRGKPEMHCLEEWQKWALRRALTSTFRSYRTSRRPPVPDCGGAVRHPASKPREGSRGNGQSEFSSSAQLITDGARHHPAAWLGGLPAGWEGFQPAQLVRHGGGQIRWTNLKGSDQSNIDKHRRLHLTAWWPDIVYWGSDEPSHRRWRWGEPPYEDGRILGRLIDDSRHPEPPAALHQEMTLRILYPGAESQDIVRLLEDPGRRDISGHTSAPSTLDP
jgi:hypothetical protein